MLQILTAALPGATLDEVRGDEETGLGWWSDRLESRVPSWLVGATTRGAAPLVIATLLCPPGDAVADLTVLRDGSLITVGWRSGREYRECVIDRSRPGAVTRGVRRPHRRAEEGGLAVGG